MSNADFTNRQEQAQAMSQLLGGLIALSNHYDEYGSKRLLHYSELERIRVAIECHPFENWMDALSKGQFASKNWLYNELRNCRADFGNMYVLGGWLGIFPFITLGHRENESVSVNRIYSIDMDEGANAAAFTLNHSPAEPALFNVAKRDIYGLNYVDDFGFKPDIVVNTICEHLSDYAAWINLIPKGTVVALQTNNMFGIDDHVNCKRSLEEFHNECGLSTVWYANELNLHDTWKRFMIIGVK